MVYRLITLTNNYTNQVISTTTKTTNRVFQKKGWGKYTNPEHVETPMILLVQEMSTGKPDEYYVKLKLHRDPTSSTLDPYEFRMFLFDHGKTEEFLVFV